MPLRHSNRLDFLWILHDWVQKQRSKFDKDNTAYRRCYYATVKRITSILQDQFRQSLSKKAYSPVSGNDVSLADWNTLLDNL